ncbi:hypothetical protein [Allostreptomyces psammosilenae]|uniref:DUF2029 domain-containing protein n=1 Tax=Allostreptomyces psammosilenae TaxID=1892865 RepID=A0A852ZV57_9ACTN|nr:hypothetical protein [Allostreptomyces psammosilenae]NYI05497.1 hypothetical protein [Allostreptomyces psammosilenae]
MLLTGVLGESAAQPPLSGGPSWLPPYRLSPADPDGAGTGWLVWALLTAAVLTGGVGLWVGLTALRRGWTPSVRRLRAAGAAAVLAMVLVPPMGSADHLVYAAYGRLAATGGDPSTQTAATLAERGDPVGLAVEPPWTDIPSVYGPVATAEQWLAAVVGGDSVHTIVFVLALLGAAAYLGTGRLLEDMAGGEAGRARVALLWLLNPPLLLVAVNAAHVDALAIFFAVAALRVLTLGHRRRVAAGTRRGARCGTAAAVLSGVLVALACATKLSFGLFVLALLWGLRRDPRAALAMLLPGLATGLLLYLPVGLGSLEQLRENARLVSLAVPLRLTVGPLEALLGKETARSLIGLVGWLLMAAVTWLLVRHLGRVGLLRPVGLLGRIALLGRTPRTSRPGAHTPEPDARTAQTDAVWAAAVLSLAWLLTAPYSLPWYDVMAWAPLALLPATALDRLAVVRTTTLAWAYVPGRAVALPAALDWVAGGVRGTVAPVVGVGLLVAVAVLGLRRNTEKPSGETPPAPISR